QSQQTIFTALKFMTQRDLSTPNLPAIKFKDPPVFKGKTEDLEDFLMAIHNGIKMQRHAFTSDEETMEYMISFWLAGMRKTSPHLLIDFSAFVPAFQSHFSDADAVGTALCNIKKFKQIGSCINYAARLRKYAAVLDLSDTSLMQHFRRDLK
ncbi:hypothetical protein M422DRAFT_88011, partial [Sphaerobolus stellatus SS14]